MIQYRNLYLFCVCLILATVLFANRHLVVFTDTKSDVSPKTGPFLGASTIQTQIDIVDGELDKVDDQTEKVMELEEGLPLTRFSESNLETTVETIQSSKDTPVLNSTLTYSYTSSVSSRSNILGSRIRECVLKADENLLWEKFVAIIQSCIVQNTKNQGNSSSLLKLKMGRFNEIKYFIPTLRKNEDQPFRCLWLTIGIGGDSQVEKEFKEKYPYCNVFGIEPGQPEQYANFTEYGTVIKTGVGVVSGEFTMSIRSNKSYIFRKVQVVPLTEILDEQLKSRIVHFVTLDIENFEYPLLKAMQGNQSFEKVVFCQLDVELHDPTVEVRFEEKLRVNSTMAFGAFFKEFIENTDFVPLIAKEFGTHRKITLVDPTDPECTKTFDFEKYLT